MNELQALLTKPVRAQALIVAVDAITFDQRESIARFAAANRLAGLRFLRALRQPAGNSSPGIGGWSAAFARSCSRRAGCARVMRSAKNSALFNAETFSASASTINWFRETLSCLAHFIAKSNSESGIRNAKLLIVFSSIVPKTAMAKAAPHRDLRMPVQNPHRRKSPACWYQARPASASYCRRYDRACTPSIPGSRVGRQNPASLRAFIPIAARLGHAKIRSCWVSCASSSVSCRRNPGTSSRPMPPSSSASASALRA